MIVRLLIGEIQFGCERRISRDSPERRRGAAGELSRYENADENERAGRVGHSFPQPLDIPQQLAQGHRQSLE
jgi:hypothetical protein